MAMALVSSAVLLAFTPPTPLAANSAMAARSSVEMSVSRRAFAGTFAAAVAAAPLAAMADGASSPAVRERARAIYGSRIFRLQGATAETILEEKNVFPLFTTGVYRTDASSKDTRKALTDLSKTALAAAKKGDSAGAQAAIKEFVKIGDCKVLDGVDGNYDPRQRRNPGAPPTAEIVAQMGTQAYSLYEAKPKGNVIGK